MSSILTNFSALTALQSLRMTQQSLNMTQKEISTGLKISSAADNASVWSIAETMKSDQGVFSTISDSLSGSSSILNVASAAVKSAITVMNDIKNAIAQASQPGADTAKILTGLQSLGKQLTGIVSSASFSSLNLLDGSQTTIKLIASYTDGKGAAASTIGTIDLTAQVLTNAGGTGILQAAQATGSAAATNFATLVVGDLAAATIADTLSNADKAIADLTSYGSTLGATQSYVDSQLDFAQFMPRSRSLP